MERAFLFWLGYMVTHTFELHGSRDVRLQAPTDPVPDLAPPYTAWGCKIEIHNSSSFFVSQCFIAEFTISHITKKNKLFLCTERICMPIRSICFLLGQLLFIPSYFYMQHFETVSFTFLTVRIKISLTKFRIFPFFFDQNSYGFKRSETV